ncbi:MAG: ABC transporter ATP-binding protein [Geodermatophilaceae bacterium]|nr:ABC transporter ATP-binding protein [Geodermatophilaceae bacterium]
MPADPLEIRGLTVAYGEVTALAEVDLNVAPGEVLALLGPSGSGKSTLLHTVAGFHPPRAGEVWLNGRCVSCATSSVPPERRELAMVFQNYALWPHLTALDTVSYPARRRGEKRAHARAQAQRILERLNIGHLAERHPAELSGGEQQRVGLARALAREASLYLFDEPTAHLDTHVRGVFLEELVTRQRDTGAAAVYAAHDAEESLGLADRVALLAAGRVIQVGTPQQVYDEPVSQLAAQLTGPSSVLTTTDGGELLVRPEWARLGGDRSARIGDVFFRGPHSDYLLDTTQGRVLLREPGPPRQRRGDEVTWSLRHSWPLRVRPGSGSDAEQRCRTGVKVPVVDDPHVPHGVGT